MGEFSMKIRLNRRHYYALGGSRNHDLIRRQTFRGWRYYLVV